MARILVQSKPARWRRINIEFSREGVRLNPAELTEEQREILDEDPMLLVSDVAETAEEKAADAEKPAGAKKGKGK